MLAQWAGCNPLRRLCAVKARPEVPGRWVAKVASVAPSGKASAVKSKKGGARSWESVMLFNEYQLTALNIRPRITPIPSVSSYFSFPPIRDPTGQSEGFQYLVLRDVGPDLLRLAGTEGGDAPDEAMAVVGHDMVRKIGLVLWTQCAEVGLCRCKLFVCCINRVNSCTLM